MKNSLSKIVLATMIAAAPLAADYSFNTNSLFAIEGGVADIDVESSEIATAGLKIGAESESYRVFLSARHFNVDDIHSLNTYGAELQYKFNFSKPVNFFIGANGGVASIKVSDSTSSESSTYYGGDAGFNIHASELIDIEIGARYMKLQDDVDTGVDTIKDYKIVSAYASLIIRWQMD